MCVNIIYVRICLYCVICLILYYRSLLICTNKEFMNNANDFDQLYNKLCVDAYSLQILSKCYMSLGDTLIRHRSST